MQYISIEEVLAIHYEIINQFGGLKGIHDFGLLHSAIERPKASFAGKDLYPTILNKTAALLHSLILNHPFKDGNKRTAYISTIRLLSINGYTLTANNKSLITYLLKIEKEKLTIKETTHWIKNHSNKL